MLTDPTPPTHTYNILDLIQPSPTTDWPNRAAPTCINVIPYNENS